VTSQLHRPRFKCRFRDFLARLWQKDDLTLSMTRQLWMDGRRDSRSCTPQDPREFIHEWIARWSRYRKGLGHRPMSRWKPWPQSPAFLHHGSCTSLLNPWGCLYARTFLTWGCSARALSCWLAPQLRLRRAMLASPTRRTWTEPFAGGSEWHRPICFCAGAHSHRLKGRADSYETRIFLDEDKE